MRAEEGAPAATLARTRSEMEAVAPRLRYAWMYEARGNGQRMADVEYRSRRTVDARFEDEEDLLDEQLAKSKKKAR